MFKPFKVSIRIETPEEGENFLRGLIVAQTNNSSDLFPQLVEGVNAGLEGARQEALEAEVAARNAADT